jgi:hypothetical protein
MGSELVSCNRLKSSRDTLKSSRYCKGSQIKYQIQLPIFYLFLEVELNHDNKIRGSSANNSKNNTPINCETIRSCKLRTVGICLFREPQQLPPLFRLIRTSALELVTHQTGVLASRSCTITGHHHYKNATLQLL